MAANTKQKKKPSKLGERLTNAISHPIRVKVLGILNRRVASPSEMAKEIGVNLSLLSHHVRVLKDEGCIELVKTEPRRGAVEHYYRANVPAYFAEEEWAKLSQPRREAISGLICQAMVSEFFGALESNSLDARMDRVLGWTPFMVDNEGWRELVEMLNEMLERTEQIRTGAAERLLGTGEEGEEVVVALMGFERSGSKTASRFASS